METLAIGLLVVGVVWYVGGFKTLQRIINTGNRVAAAYDNDNKVKVANRLANIELSTETMEKAMKNKAMLDGFDL